MPPQLGDNKPACLIYGNADGVFITPPHDIPPHPPTHIHSARTKEGQTLEEMCHPHSSKKMWIRTLAVSVIYVVRTLICLYSVKNNVLQTSNLWRQVFGG